MLKVELQRSVVWLTLNKPPANALDNATLRDLVAHLTQIRDNGSVRGVVLTGAGDKFFCAGGDVKEFSAIDIEAGLERVRLGSRLKSALAALECPLVCAVNGTAVGSGMEMAALADFCVTSRTARFGMPEINHGLLPMAKGIQHLVFRIGLQNTKRVLFGGDIFPAAEAAEMGLVDEVVSPEALADRAREWITDMAGKQPALFRALKRTIVQSPFLSDEELEQMTESDFLTYFGTNEAKASLSSVAGSSGLKR
jgi:enoyl-CoA hydratase/carnithine racemase